MNDTSLILPQTKPLMSTRKGMGGHHSARAGTHIWLTPPWVIKALGDFDLDPCAAPNPRPWDTAKTHYTAPAQDGLSLPWDGRVWLNPPYGDAVGRWLAKLGRHGAGTALIFARTETEAFHSEVFAKADAILFLEGRLFFHYPSGLQAEANAGAPSVLCAYGADDAELLRYSGIRGRFMGLKLPVLLHMVMTPDTLGEEKSTWREIVIEAMRGAGGAVKLSELYSYLENHPKVKATKFWREKIRQTIGRLGLPKIAEGQYALAL